MICRHPPWLDLARLSLLCLTHPPNFTTRPSFTVTAAWAKLKHKPLLLAAHSKIAEAMAMGRDGLAEKAEYDAMLRVHRGWV